MAERLGRGLQNLVQRFESALDLEYKYHAKVAQLVEHNLAKVGVASSSLVFRSFFQKCWSLISNIFFWFEMKVPNIPWWWNW